MTASVSTIAKRKTAIVLWSQFLKHKPSDLGRLSGKRDHSCLTQSFVPPAA